jgi:DNA-binding transcriptional ArsR family regulator
MDANILTALAEPNRLRIVELLREQPYPVGEIAERLSMRQPQVSKHLRVLSEAGIVAMRPNAQQRVYQLQSQPFEELESWLSTFRQLWNQRLDDFDAYLQQLKAQERDKP